MKKCSICGTKLVGSQTRFCSTACKNRHHQSYEAQQRRGRERRLALIRMYGGCCSICGYSRNLAALSFHHKGNKTMKLDLRNLSNRSWDVVEAEAEKCRLMCANCHMELHHPELSNVDIMGRKGLAG